MGIGFIDQFRSFVLPDPDSGWASRHPQARSVLLLHLTYESRPNHVVIGRDAVGDRLPPFSVETLDESSFHARDRNAKRRTVPVFPSSWCASSLATTHPAVLASCCSAREQVDSLAGDGPARMLQRNIPQNTACVLLLRALSCDAHSQIVTRDRGTYHFPSV